MHHVRAKTLFLQLWKLLPLTLLIVSVSIIALPSDRIDSTLALPTALLTLECFWLVGWSERHQYLSKTLHQAAEAVEAGARARTALPEFGRSSNSTRATAARSRA